MVSAIARTIPTVAGFGAMCPLLVPDRQSPCGTLEGESGEMGELLHTSLVVQEIDGRAGRPKNNGLLEEYPVTAVTAAEAKARHVARAVDTEAPPPPWVLSQFVLSRHTRLRLLVRH